MDSKGQAALEGLMIMLMIVSAVGIIALKISQEAVSMKELYVTRVLVQEVAFNMTLEGSYTNIIKLNQSGTTMNIDLISTNCDIANEKIKQLETNINAILKKKGEDKLTMTPKCYKAYSCDNCTIQNEVIICNKCENG